MNRDVTSEIRDLIQQHPVLVFMKGTRQMPRCGFSASVVEALDALNTPFKDVDVLADPDLREGIKQFSDWPTIPQLYLRGSFVGGCDIVRQLADSGELARRIHG